MGTMLTSAVMRQIDISGLMHVEGLIIVVTEFPNKEKNPTIHNMIPFMKIEVFANFKPQIPPMSYSLQCILHSKSLKQS